MGAVTRKDVANAAGVSVAVVSYVVNGGPRPVAAATRDRVLAVIDQLGYSPDGVAQALAAGSSRSIGLVVPDIRMPYFSGIAQEIITQAAVLGLQVFIATSQWSMDSEAHQLKSMAKRRVDGVILMSTDPDMIRERSHPVPTVMVDRPGYAIHGSSVVTGHLIDHGCSRIGLLSALGRHTASRRRFQGWQQALHQAGLALGAHAEAEATEYGGYQAGLEFEDCDAVVTETDVQAIGLMSWWHQMKISCPGQVLLASTDSTSIAPYAVPSITGLVQPSRDIAYEAVRALVQPEPPSFQALNHKEFALQPRQSCGCHG